MSLAMQTLGLVRYPPERLCESMFLANIAGNTVAPHFAIPDITPALVWVKELGMARNASLQAVLTGQVSDRNYENRFDFMAASHVLDDAIPIDSPFDREVFLNIANVTALAVANYQARVIYDVLEPRVADKIGIGLSDASLTPEELELADEFLIREKVQTGELPMPYPKGALQYTRVGQHSAAVVALAAGETTILEVAVPDDHKVVLTDVWCGQPVANFGALEIRVYRERRLFLTLFPFMFPDWATIVRHISSIPLWIPSLNHLQVTIWSGTGHAAILAQAKAEVRKLTIYDKMAWPLPKKVKLSAEERGLVDRLNLRDKMDAGIYDLYTPMAGGALGKP